MDRDEIRNRISLLLEDLIDEEVGVLTDDTVAEDVSWWDSLVNLKLLVAIEGEWGVSFQVSELNAPRNVGELVDLVQSKLLA